MLTLNASLTFLPRSCVIIRTSGIILFLSGLLLNLCLASPLDENATREFLVKIVAARKARPSIQAEFREEKTGGILSRPAISKGKLWYTAPDKFRRETVGSGRESLIVSNGQLLWMYYPAFKEAERYDLTKQKFLNQGIAAFTTGLGLENVERDFKVSVDETREGSTVTLIPRRSSISRLLTQLVVRFNPSFELQSVETLSPKGEKTLTELNNLQTKSVPESIFEFSPPEGATVSAPLGK